MKKKILLIVIILIIVCIFTYYVGIYFGKIQERKQLIEENINSDTYVNNDFDFVRREKEDYKNIIPNTILKIKELDVKNKRIKISYTTYDKKEDNSNRYMLGTFMLEKKIQDKWFEINAVTKLPKQTAITIENVNTGNRKEKLDNINVENANKYIKGIDIEVR